LGELIKRLKSKKRRIVLMTAHRRENFGRPFGRVLKSVLYLARKFPEVDWIYPVHPNPNVLKPARKVLGRQSNIHLFEPIDYTDLVQVMDASALVVTDSGGLQEEAPSLGKPVLVLRDVTERPEAVDAGTVILVGTNEKKIIGEFSKLLTDPRYYRRIANAVNPYGDGKASDRITHAIRWYFGISKSKPNSFRARA
jgi:UDP-N-acetylglucosamine 2-epimerase (non-hydrolysing)